MQCAAQNPVHANIVLHLNTAKIKGISEDLGHPVSQSLYMGKALRWCTKYLQAGMVPGRLCIQQERKNVGGHSTQTS